MAIYNLGKIVSVIESTRRAAASISRDPIVTTSVLETLNELSIADWELPDGDSTLFIFGAHQWGDTTKKVAK